MAARLSLAADCKERSETQPTVARPESPASLRANPLPPIESDTILTKQLCGLSAGEYLAYSESNKAQLWSFLDQIKLFLSHQAVRVGKYNLKYAIVCFSYLLRLRFLRDSKGRNLPIGQGVESLVSGCHVKEPRTY